MLKFPTKGSLPSLLMLFQDFMDYAWIFDPNEKRTMKQKKRKKDKTTLKTKVKKYIKNKKEKLKKKELKRNK